MSNSLEYINSLASFIFGTISWYQAKQQYAQSQKLHAIETSLAKSQHIIETKMDIEQQNLQLDADLINATKESERDMYDSRNQQLQTIIVASSVMFAALSTVIIQGVLPQGTTSTYLWVTVTMGVSGGLSFTMLFLSIVYCVEILMKASKFMIKRASSHKGIIREYFLLTISTYTVYT